MNMSLRGWLGKVWRVIRWPVWAVLALFVGLCIYRIPAVLEAQKTELKTLKDDFNSLDQRIADLEGKFEEVSVVPGSL
ncbi:hypothetical protein K8Q93_00230 [Candidatus Parcubacteria bacterium]|nr:hypothetical protein [Candidatus Parcubacteria bacterium]